MKKTMIIGGSIAAAMMLMTGIAVTTLIAAAVMLTPPADEKIEFKNGELYYSDSVSQQDAQKLADFLEKTYGELENQKTFKLDRSGDEMIVKMCAQSKTWETDELDYSFMALEMLLQTQVFKNQNVVFELCDANLNIKKTIDEYPKAEDRQKSSE